MTDIEHQSEKEKLSQLHGKAKAEYILTYYRIYFIFALIAIIAVVIIVNAVENAKKESKIGVAVLNAANYDLQEADDWQNKIAQELGFGEYEYATVTMLNYPTADSQMTEESIASQEKLVTMVAVKQIDMIIAPETLNRSFTENVDYFLDLSTYLPEDIYGKLQEEGRIETLTNSEGQTFPALIHLTQEEISSEISLQMEDPTIGIVANSENRDNTIRLLRRFLGMQES